jgi:hypothetical protein
VSGGEGVIFPHTADACAFSWTTVETMRPHVFNEFSLVRRRTCLGLNVDKENIVGAKLGVLVDKDSNHNTPPFKRCIVILCKALITGETIGGES